MEQIKLSCACGAIFTEEEFANHFRECRPFKNVFREFDYKFGDLLKSYSEPKEKLLIVRFLLKQYINVIDKKLERMYKNDFPSFVREVAPIQNQLNIDSNNICQRCKINPDIIYLSCFHPICNKCFNECAEENINEMRCNICQNMVAEQDKRMVLGEERKTQLERKAVTDRLKEKLVKCPNCGEKIVFEPGEVDYNVKDENSQVISGQAAEDYAKHRCRCGFCQKDFCSNEKCNATPYHLGKTCEEFKHYIGAKKCRFCNKEIQAQNIGPDEDVCNSYECKNKYFISCKKRLPCGHKCFGVYGERECPPCIDKKCNQFNGKFGQNKDEYCIICWVEGLGNSPMIALSCGHYMHYLCIKNILEKKWNGPKITFNHCLCPSCHKWMDCPAVPEIQKMIEENKKLYEEIKDMSLKRLKFEDLDKDPRLTDKNSPWYGKKVEFALKRLSYYMCYICKKPYFAGRRECGNDPNMNNDDPNKLYNPKDCVCGKDANLSGVAGKTNCVKHGKEFIEYKCRFCCKIASWFCWGTTHFCEDCHKRQCNHDYVSQYKKDKLPKCNKDTCEVGGNHPPNGEEYALGCSICRNSEENARDF